jgi:hypothetical protein
VNKESRAPVAVTPVPNGFTHVMTADGTAFVCTSASSLWHGLTSLGELVFVLQDSDFKPLVSLTTSPEDAVRFVELVSALVNQKAARATQAVN